MCCEFKTMFENKINYIMFGAKCLHQKILAVETTI